MDSLTKYQHDKGTRAYLSFQGNKFLQDSDGNMWPVYSTDEESVKDWQALRDYQDAERKKGVPIKWDWSWTENNGKWGDSHFAAISRGYMMPTVWTDPRYNSEGDLVGASGQFTNFRWRAGYPKGGNND